MVTAEGRQPADGPGHQMALTVLVQRGKERVGQTERVALRCMHSHVCTGSQWGAAVQQKLSSELCDDTEGVGWGERGREREQVYV